MWMSNETSFGGTRAISSAEETSLLGGCTTKVSPSNIPSANIVASRKIVALFVDNESNTWLY